MVDHRPVGLVGCGKQKADQALPARLLYTSTLFRLASAHCERTCRRWFVLSARHGLVHPDEVLEPYELSLADLSAAQRVAWGQCVAARLAELGLAEARLEIHAGELYRAALLAAGLQVCSPLVGLPVGKRLAWYRQQSD